MRYRTTVRGKGIELRGYIDEEHRVNDVAEALLRKFGPLDHKVIVSPVEDDYDPFPKDENP